MFNLYTNFAAEYPMALIYLFVREQFYWILWFMHKKRFDLIPVFYSGFFDGLQGKQGKPLKV